MGSTRLPGKVLKPLEGKSVLEWILYRLSRSKLIQETVVATSTLKRDNAIESFCHKHSYCCYRGNETNVMDRFCQVAIQNEASHILRVTADSPFIDVDLCDTAIALLLSDPDLDYISNVLPPRTFPQGINCEVFTTEALLRSSRLVNDHELNLSDSARSYHQEHVTTFIRENPHRFTVYSLNNDANCFRHRWTLDTAQDLEFATRVFRYFQGGEFSWQQLLNAVESNQIAGNYNETTIPTHT